MEEGRQQLTKTEQLMRELRRKIRDAVTIMRQRTMVTSDEGWRELHRTAHLEQNIADVFKRARPGSRGFHTLTDARTVLDSTRRAQIDDEQWEQIKRVLHLDTLSLEIESVADSIRDYLAAPHDEAGLQKYIAENTATINVIEARMAAI